MSTKGNMQVLGGGRRAGGEGGGRNTKEEWQDKDSLLAGVQNIQSMGS